jgi:hypothetical protein
MLFNIEKRTNRCPYVVRNWHQHNLNLLPRENFGLLNKVDFFTVPTDFGIASRLNAPAASRQTVLFVRVIPPPPPTIF